MPVGSPDGRHPEEHRSWLKDSSPKKTPYLAQIGSFCLKMPCQSEKNTLSGSDRLVLPENALPDFWTGKAFSSKTSLSEPDRVFFGFGRHFQAKRAYLSQIVCFLDWEGILKQNEPI